MNLQKDLIQHIAVLTVAPGYLNFDDPRSSQILHVGLDETRLLLLHCLSILAAEDAADAPKLFQTAGQIAPPVLSRYAQAFRLAAERINGLSSVVWNDDLDARYALDPVISDLDLFLGGEHWYDVDRARLIRFPDGTYYQNCARVCVSSMSNWHRASLFFSDETVRCALDRLEARFGLTGEAVPVAHFDPPMDYLWRARTYAPQSPQSMINYWEALLPGARRVRIKQLVSQVSPV